MIGEQIPGTDAHFFSLLNDFVMGIKNTPLLNGQRNCPGDAESKRLFLLSYLVGAKIQSVISEIHAEGQKRFFVDSGNAVPYKCVVCAVFIGQHGLNISIELLLKPGVSKAGSHIDQIAGRALRISLQIFDGIFYNGGY